MGKARGLAAGGAAFLLTALLVAGCGLFGGGGEAAPTATGTVTGRVVLPTRQAGGVEGLIATVQDTDIASPVQPDGTFELEGVPAGEQTISVISEEGDLGAHVVATVEPGKVTDVGEVEPVPTGMIAGIVSGKTSSGELKPVAGARVMARPILSEEEKLSDLANGRPFLVARTNRRGEYVIRAVPPGKYLLEARHPDYAPATKEVTVEAHSTANGDLVMEPKPQGGAVHGKVVADLQGKELPVPGALVALVPKGEGIKPPPPVQMPLEATVGELISSQQAQKQAGPCPECPWRRPLFTFTKADGTYRLDGVPPGDYTAIAFKAGYGREENEVTVPEGQDVEVNFTLHVELGTISGKVTRADTGEPISGAHVWAVSLTDPFVLWEGMGERAGRLPAAELTRRIARIPPIRAGTTTDEEGNYSLQVRPGRYIVVAWARGFVRSTREVEVAANETVEANFSLEPMSSPPAPPWGRLVLSLKLDKGTFRLGEPVEVELTIRNVSQEEVELVFPTSQRFDLSVRDMTGREVWRWSHDKVFLQVVVKVTLKPGEEMEFEAVWNQKDNDGRQVPAGEYVMVGELACSQKLTSHPVPFRIVPRPLWFEQLGG